MASSAASIRTYLLAAGLVFLLIGTPAKCRADDAYFVLIFSAQQVPNCPRYSHSFATFVHAANDGQSMRLEHHTISWLPVSLNIRVLRLRPEPGRDLDLDTTLAFVESLGDRISLWGPYQIRKDLYDRALEQIAHLNSGAVQYKAVDALYRTMNVSNCIHALSELADNRGRLRITSPGFGEVASYYIAHRFEPGLMDPEQVHPWVGTCLGLENHPITPRAWGEVPRRFFRCGFPDGP
jgi:hypothetical protein